MRTTSAWAEYLRWNTAVCETVFTQVHAGQPVYLDMDQDVLSSVAELLSVGAKAGTRELVTAVRGTLILDRNQSDVFRGHLQQLAAWRRSITEHREDLQHAAGPPPVVALLAVFTLAAEAMGSDESFAASAYYPRLAELLNVESDRDKYHLQHAYQDAAERLWRGLNDWLALSDGRYGVPTAYALSHRYVGLPLSQALIRAADRRHLTRMFRQFGLAPGSDLPPTDMARLLDLWIQQIPCPASKNLQNLWQRPGAQDRIAEIAATELQSWDDTLADEASMPSERLSGDVQLMAQLQRFPRTALQLSFLATMPGNVPPEELTVSSAQGAPSLQMLPVSGRTVRPRSAMDIDTKSMVEGVLRVVDPRTTAEGRRFPRRVVPLRRDEATNAFVECERVQLGEDFILLVKDEGPLLNEVRRLLESIARPGHKAYGGIPGLPPGWAVITNLQVLATPSSDPRRADLNALVPLVSSQLNIAGGLKLPGNLRKWSSLCPPEIRAVSQLGGGLELRLTRVELGTGEVAESRTWRSSQGVLLVDLADEELDDGDYELALVGGGNALQRSSLRLRSSDSPDRWSWETRPRLAYNLRTGLGTIAASQAAAVDDADVQGAATAQQFAEGPADTKFGVSSIWWSAAARPPREAVPIVIASPDPKSCVVTGAHHIQLPPALGKPTAAMMSGYCTQCGLVKRYPTWPRRGRRKREWYEVEVDQPGRLANIREAVVQTVTRDDALDALTHLGGGTASSLERVAAHVDSSALEVDTFRRGLETLGHVDMSRGDRLEPTRWAIAPPCLAEASDGTFFLTGAWSDAARLWIESAVDEAGGKFSYNDNRGEGPTTWFIEELSLEQIEDLAADPDLRGLNPHGIRPKVVPRAAMSLLRALPPLSSLVSAVPRAPLPGARRIERFDLMSASWEPVHTAASPGAYRLESSFRTSYVFRSEQDVERQEVAIGTAQLVKHLEALRMGRPLLGYYPKSERLAVPLGADLPGLYGRATVLNSGRLPGRSSKSRSLVYFDVPAAFASRLFEVLAS